MKTQIKIVFAIALILVAFTSCFDGIIVEGNNEVTQETRSLPNFTEVSSSGSYHIYYQHGDSTKATIICESNILSYIETAVYNGRLDIKTAFHVSINPNKMIEIYVESPEIEEIELSGSGIIETDTVYGDELEVWIFIPNALLQKPRYRVQEKFSLKVLPQMAISTFQDRAR